MLIVRYVLVTIVGYLIGSFPTGYLVARYWKGVDPRQGGSGRTGGTNVLRTAGKWAAIVTALGDVIKGATAMYVGRWLLNTDPALVLTGLAAVMGHNRSIFLGFRGGAGTSANIGVLLGWTPQVVPFVLVVGVLTAMKTHVACVA